MENKRKYITGIDGLRSIAVLGVILYHLAPRVMPGGFLGVTLFFVISGYLMTDILLSEWQERKKIGLTNFYFKRARRIYPSLFIVFVLSGSTFLFLSKDLLINFRQIVISSLLNFNNFWQILNGASYFDRFGNESPFTHLWSLSFEGQFYFLWPILIAFLLYKQENHNRVTRFILYSTVLSSILMIAFYSPDSLNRIYYGTDTRIYSILMGAYLAIFLRDRMEFINRVTEKQKITAFSLCLIFIFGSFIIFKDNSDLVYQGGMIIFSLVSVLLLAIVIISEKSNSYLTNPLFKWIGTRSYEIYLWQFPVMVAYEKLVKWDGSNSLLHILLQFFIILLMSELTYQLVFYIRHNISFSREWLNQALRNDNNRLKLLSVFLVVALFSYSFYIAPSGRSAESISLEKKLNENKKIIADGNQEKENTIESSTTSNSAKDNDSKEKTENSSEKSTEEEIQADKDLIKLSQQELDFLRELNLTAVGDSLLLSAAPEIKNIFPKAQIDAEVGRQFSDSQPIFEKMKKDSLLGDIILVVLGTNGSFSTKDVSEIMNLVDGKDVFFVNTMVQRPWQKAVNDELSKTNETYKNAHVIDWKDYSNGMGEWFDVDDVHLVPEGAANFSALIGKNIYDEVNK